jgi:tetratricopeptide (TPR) repeat protein
VLIMSKFVSPFRWLATIIAGLASRVVAGVLSNRGLTVAALLGCALLSVSTWLRPAISRDFRAIHIPWSGGLNAEFSPDRAVAVPRPWRWDSVGAPICVLALASMPLVLLRPKWTPIVFGALLALSITGLAAAFWNHPAIVEFLEGEVRQRAMIRAVIREQADDMLSGGAPDRLELIRGQLTMNQMDEIHPLWHPIRYSIYGPYLLALTLVGIFASQRGRWAQRIWYSGKWALVGVGFAAAVTFPRWLAEYRIHRSASLESGNQWKAAEQSLEKARDAMPQLSYTRRYWQTRGRLEYRQHLDNEYVTFFKAMQHLQQAKPGIARAEIESDVIATGGSIPQRDLLGVIIGRLAVHHAYNDNQTAAAVAWREAATVAPWEPAYSIAATATALAVAPARAAEMKDQMLPWLIQVGDRLVNSDFSSVIADAYFETGDLHAARDMYNKAMITFDLPKYVNLHAQKGLLGM